MTDNAAIVWTLGLLLGLPLAGLALHDFYEHQPMTDPSPSVSVPVPQSSAVPMDKAIDPDDVAVRIKNESIDRCEVGGGIVAMGFGFKVVCLKPQSVEWTRSPGFQPFKSELKR